MLHRAYNAQICDPKQYSYNDQNSRRVNFSYLNISQEEQPPQEQQSSCSTEFHTFSETGKSKREIKLLISPEEKKEALLELELNDTLKMSARKAEGNQILSSFSLTGEASASKRTSALAISNFLDDLMSSSTENDSRNSSVSSNGFIGSNSYYNILNGNRSRDAFENTDKAFVNGKSRGRRENTSDTSVVLPKLNLDKQIDGEAVRVLSAVHHDRANSVRNGAIGEAFGNGRRRTSISQDSRGGSGDKSALDLSLNSTTRDLFEWGTVEPANKPGRNTSFTRSRVGEEGKSGTFYTAQSSDPFYTLRSTEASGYWGADIEVIKRELSEQQAHGEQDEEEDEGGGGGGGVCV